MKLTRYNGHVPLFSQDMQGRERTLFGSTVQDDDINKQFTPEFLRGWGSVGSTEFPTLQDFNALAYTHNKLLSYLYQAGIPSYSQNEEYYIGSIVQYNKDIYICLKDKPTVLPADEKAWKRVQESLTFVGDGPEVMKRGAGGLLGFTSDMSSLDNTLSVITRTRNSILSDDIFPSVSYYNGIWFGYAANRFSGIFVEAGLYRAFIVSQTLKRSFEIHTTGTTRTDKNNVLHAGTTTPINTLNVSDMSQEVINNDLLTVTSGAVYRALLEKADLTYVNTELNKKITGGNVVQTTGQSAVDVMSQKVVTDAFTSTMLKAENGWHRDATTGFIFQWGTLRDTNVDTINNFPIAFPSKCLGIVSNINAFESSAIEVSQPFNITNSTFQMSLAWQLTNQQGGGENYETYWLAYGY